MYSHLATYTHTYEHYSVIIRTQSYELLGVLKVFYGLFSKSN